MLRKMIRNTNWLIIKSNQFYNDQECRGYKKEGSKDNRKIKQRKRGKISNIKIEQRK